MRSGRQQYPTMEGLIVLDKPPGLTSARAVGIVKKCLPHHTKIGHAGTLDPFATGVLILLIGKATRQCEKVMSWPKTYEATVRLGATTPTDDPESPEQPPPGPLVPPPAAQVEAALTQFVGRIEQRPPVYSAIKIGGKRASDRARRGDPVELQPRIVTIHSIHPLAYHWPVLRLRIECGRGTYIRSIARDLGGLLGVGGYLTALRRTRIGQFSTDEAVQLDQITPDNLRQHLHPLDLPEPAPDAKNE